MRKTNYGVFLTTESRAESVDETRVVVWWTLLLIWNSFSCSKARNQSLSQVRFLKNTAAVLYINNQKLFFVFILVFVLRFGFGFFVALPW